MKSWLAWTGCNGERRERKRRFFFFAARPNAHKPFPTPPFHILSHGFINYYGRQRFGTGAGRTHAVGAAIARGDLSAAAALVLAPRGAGDDAARQAWLDGNADAAATAQVLHRGAVAERALLTVLSRSPSDYATAFTKIPRNLRTMYTHALQSWLWNVGASARAAGVVHAASAATVVEGDVLLASEAEGSGDDGGDSDTVGPATDAPRRAARVRLAAPADTASASPSRVVLPLVAPGMLHPTHAAGAAVATAAAAVGVDAGTGGPADPAARPPPRSVGGPAHAAGGYRRLTVVPSNTSLRFVTHAGADDDVLTEGGGLAEGVKVWEVGQPLPSGHHHLAAIVTFDLPKSAYATMALRELMRRPSVGAEAREER